MSYMMLPSAWYYLQEHINFFLAKKKRITTKKTDLSCDTVPLKGRLRLPSLSSSFAILSQSVQFFEHCTVYNILILYNVPSEIFKKSASHEMDFNNFDKNLQNLA